MRKPSGRKATPKKASKRKASPKKAAKAKPRGRAVLVPRAGAPLQVVYRRIDTLIPYAKNARTHSPEQIEEIMAWIREIGWTNPILIDEKGGVIAGHGRILAGVGLGFEEVPCIIKAGLSNAQRKAYRLADNQIALNSGWDVESLKDELLELKEEDFDLTLVGFAADEIFQLTNEQEGEKAERNSIPDDIKKRCKPGDLWQLGLHRLACGDCRDAKQVNRLMSGASIDLAISSPPYASQRKYDEGSEFKPIHPKKYVGWFDAVQKRIGERLSEGGSWFINIKEHCEGGARVMYVRDLVSAHVREWGWTFVDEFAWVHGGTPKAVHQRFKNGWEPIFQFTRSKPHRFNPDAVMHATKSVPDWEGLHPSREDIQGSGGLEDKQTGSNAANQGQGRPNGGIPPSLTKAMAYPSNVLSLGKNRVALGHPAAYPTSLPEFFIRAYSDLDSIVFDPFMGSGTTIIAAEENERACYGFEISPHYCDVVLARWEALTGEKAKRIKGRS